MRQWPTWKKFNLIQPWHPFGGGDNSNRGNGDGNDDGESRNNNYDGGNCGGLTTTAAAVVTGVATAACYRRDKLLLGINACGSINSYVDFVADESFFVHEVLTTSTNL